MDYSDNQHYIIKFVKLSHSQLLMCLRFNKLKAKEFVYHNDDKTSNPYVNNTLPARCTLTKYGLRWLRLMVLSDWKQDRDYTQSIFRIRKYIPFINYFFIKKFFVKKDFKVVLLIE